MDLVIAVLLFGGLTYGFLNGKIPSGKAGWISSLVCGVAIFALGLLSDLILYGLGVNRFREILGFVAGWAIMLYLLARPQKKETK